MNNRQIAAVYEDLKKLAGNEIRTAGGNDLVTVWRLFEKMDALINLQYCAANFRILLESTEDEESRELVQKHLHIFMTTVYMDYLEEVIGTAGSEKAGSAGVAYLQVGTWSRRSTPSGVRVLLRGSFLVSTARQ